MQLAPLSGRPHALFAGAALLAALSACSQQDAKDDGLTSPTVSTGIVQITSDEDSEPQLAIDIEQAKIDLGRRLMFDVALSRPRGVSCGMCHDPTRGWGDARPQGKGVQDNTLDSEGHDTQLAVSGNRYKTFLTPRNTPTVYNSHLFDNQFWDGRAGDLEHQAQFPFEAGPEMNSNWDEHILPILHSDAKYRRQFKRAYGDPVATRERASEAIGKYERTISVFDTPYDAFLGGDMGALSVQEKQGHDLFFGAAGCATCHPGPMLTDMGFHNTGVPTAGRLALEGVVDLGFGVRTDLTQVPAVDIDEPTDYAKFKTPQLRMLAVTGPYMHNGALRTLEEVVEFYDQGGGPDLSGTGTKHPAIVPLGLTESEKTDLVAFLRTGLMGTEIR